MQVDQVTQLRRRVLPEFQKRGFQIQRREMAHSRDRRRQNTLHFPRRVSQPQIDFFQAQDAQIRERLKEAVQALTFNQMESAHRQFNHFVEPDVHDRQAVVVLEVQIQFVSR
ncbi:hypothetical protein D3C87_1754570 [compost metagenome]